MSVNEYNLKECDVTTRDVVSPNEELTSKTVIFKFTLSKIINIFTLLRHCTFASRFGDVVRS